MGNEPKTLNDAFAAVNQELLTMFIRKHKDYGKGNILSVKELGIAMRILEKIERIKHLVTAGSQPTNESVEETWTDIAVYAVIAILLRRGQFEKLEIPKEILESL
jgi:hypothetical protein